MALITEDHLEQQCLEWFQELGYAYAFAPDLAPDGTTPERTDFRQVILTGRLRSALQRLNPEVPASTIESAVLQLANPNVPGLLASNRNFHAVRAAVESVVKASRPDGDKKGGVVWHTQGAGKSIEMACLAGKLLTDPRLENPTLVMVTDRQDLDGQLFGVFAGAGDLLDRLRALKLAQTTGMVLTTREARWILGRKPVANKTLERVGVNAWQALTN